MRAVKGGLTGVGLREKDMGKIVKSEDGHLI